MKLGKSRAGMFFLFLNLLSSLICFLVEGKGEKGSMETIGKAFISSVSYGKQLELINQSINQ